MHRYFWFEIQQADLIVARAGRSWVVGIGEVSGQAYYDPETARCCLPVEWKRVAFEKTWRVSSPLLPRQTIAKLSETRFQQIEALAR